MEELQWTNQGSYIEATTKDGLIVAITPGANYFLVEVTDSKYVGLGRRNVRTENLSDCDLRNKMSRSVGNAVKTARKHITIQRQMENLPSILDLLPIE